MKAGEICEYHDRSTWKLVKVAQGRTRQGGKLACVKVITVREKADTNNPLKNWDFVYGEAEWVDTECLNKLNKRDADESLNALKYEADGVRDSERTAAK